jgi:tetratricopeptide (TPR) repeat protein
MEIEKRLAAIGETLVGREEPLSDEEWSAALEFLDALLAASESDAALSLIRQLKGGAPLSAAIVLELVERSSRAYNLLGRPTACLDLVDGLDPGWETTTNFRLRARIRLNYAQAKWRLGDLGTAQRDLSAIYHELAAHPETPELGLAAWHLGSVAEGMGDIDQARNRYLEALVSGRRTANQFLQAGALANLGRLERNQCEWGEALRTLVSARKAFVAISNRRLALLARQMLAVAYYKLGRLDLAQTTLRECESPRSKETSTPHAPGSTRHWKRPLA